MNGDSLDLDTEVDRIYQIPLTDFIAERNALAKRLRAADRRDEAAAITALRKPPVSAWAVNRLAQLAPDLLAELRAAGEALRAAQQQGQGHREALAARRKAVVSLVARAEELLGGAGHAASAATLQRITKTLEAIAAYGEAGPEPPVGRLRDDLEPPGIEALTVFGVAPARRGTKTPSSAPSVPPGPRRLAASSTPTPARSATARQRSRAREDLAAAKARLGERRRRARLTSDRRRRAEAVEEQAARAVAEAERVLERARQRLAEAAETTRGRRDEAVEAAADLRRAEEAVEAAQQSLAELER